MNTDAVIDSAQTLYEPSTSSNRTVVTHNQSEKGAKNIRRNDIADEEPAGK